MSLNRKRVHGRLVWHMVKQALHQMFACSKSSSTERGRVDDNAVCNHIRARSSIVITQLGYSS